MRPLNLIISGFGPYAGRVELPMRELGEQGLYIIAGSTGAGKTTIFDAICYALFGSASGNNRTEEMLRSNYADDKTPTEVELTFVHKGKEYTIKRNPEYFKAKGTGTVKVSKSVTLTMPDGRDITGKTAVKQAIDEILGITREQFSQIAMLAQGDFLKILFAGTKERNDLFRKIFNTGNYDELQSKLDKEKNNISKELERERLSVDQYISGIKVHQDDSLSIDVGKALDGKLTTEDVLELLEKLIEKDNESKSALNKSLEDIRTELGTVDKAIGAADALETAGKNLEADEKKLREEEPVLEKAEVILTEAKENYKGKAALDKAANRIETQIPDYDNAEKVRKDIASEEENLKKLSDRLSSKKTSIDDDRKKLENLKEVAETVSDADVKLEKLRTELGKLKEKSDSLSDLKKDFARLIAKHEELTEAQADYLAKDETYKEKKRSYESMDDAFRLAQAGILASRLVPGEACPVCGSKEHPKPADMPEGTPSEADCKAAKELADSAGKERDKASEDAAGLKQAYDVMKDNLEEKFRKLIPSEFDLSSAEQEIEEAVSKCSSDVRTMKSLVAKAENFAIIKQELGNEIPALQKHIEEQDKAIGTLEVSIASAETSLKGKREELAKLSEKLKFPGKAEAVAEIKRLEADAKALQDALDAANEEVRKRKESIAALKANIESLKKTISESKAEDIEELRKRKDELTAVQQDLTDRRTSVELRLSANTDILDKIKGKAAGITTLEKKYQWVAVLADTASGKLTGKSKMMLETYVQGTYFDRIIARANRRLYIMSDKQYELVRVKGGGKQSQVGLELNVVDHYDGSERNVKSLSGGESFLASLSLALGLSDEVQANVGGIRIDTLFVDEGFGSLDPETLNLAYKALVGLTEGNKLVGIISHVGDLKDRIDNKILVEKDKHKGSTARLEV